MDGLGIRSFPFWVLAFFQVLLLLVSGSVPPRERSHIPPNGERKTILKSAFVGDMLVPWRVVPFKWNETHRFFEASPKWTHLKNLLRLSRWGLLHYGSRFCGAQLASNRVERNDRFWRMELILFPIGSMGLVYLAKRPQSRVPSCRGICSRVTKCTYCNYMLILLGGFTYLYLVAHDSS